MLDKTHTLHRTLEQMATTKYKQRLELYKQFIEEY